MIPSNQDKQRRQRPGLMAYLERRLGAPVGREPEVQFACPFCVSRVGDESSKPKLRFNTEKGAAICFRCEFRANSLKAFFIALNGGSLRVPELALLHGEVESAPVSEVYYTTLLKLYGPRELPRREAELRAVRLPFEYAPLWEAKCAGDLAPHLRRGYNYATRSRDNGGRGLTRETLKRFRIGYCATGDYAGRLIFPVLQNGRQVYFTNRYCGDHPLKSKNPPNREGFFTASRCLLNYDNVIGAPCVNIVEGPIDCTAPAQAVALLNKIASPAQLELLESLVERGTSEFVVTVDSDADASAIYAALLDRVPKVSVLALRYGDPDSRRAEFGELMESRGALTWQERVRSKLCRHK